MHTNPPVGRCFTGDSRLQWVSMNTNLRSLLLLM
jgi:hypothetical protein